MFNRKKDFDFTMPMIVIGALLLLTLLLNAAVTDKPSTALKFSRQRMPSAPSTTVPGYEQGAYVMVADQMVGGEVTILSSALKKDGFIALYNRKTGKFIGASDFMKQGDYKGKSLPIIESQPSGEQILAVLYADNGDGVFNAGKNDVSLSVKSALDQDSFVAAVTFNAK